MAGPFEAGGGFLGGIFGGTVGAAGGAAVGGVEGGAEGAAAGTLVEPGGGTIIGGGIGAGIGATEGAVAGRAIGAHAGSAVGQGAGRWLDNKLGYGDRTEACSTCKPKNPCEHLKKGSGDGDYRGGAHGDPKKDVGTSSPSGDELDSHHMPAKQSYSGTGLDSADGPAIQMEPEDHQDTSDYGGRGRAARSKQAQQIQSGNFYQVLDESVSNVREIAKSRGDPNRYNKAIKEARDYKDCLKAHELLPSTGAE